MTMTSGDGYRVVIVCLPQRHLRLAAAAAGVVGLSPSHFARKFRHSVGVSVNRFVNRRRIRRAFGRLGAGSPELSRLALDLGFSSQSHFTRVFSGLTGITPLQFRRLRARADARSDPG